MTVPFFWVKWLTIRACTTFRYSLKMEKVQSGINSEGDSASVEGNVQKQA